MRLDTNRLQNTATYVYLIGYLIPLAYTCLLAFQRGDTSLGFWLGGFAIAACFLLWRVYRVGLVLWTRIVILVAISMFFIVLVFTGGYANTGLLWCYAVFVATYHFGTAWIGLILNLSLIALTGIVVHLPALAALTPDYESATIERFLLTASITTILLFMYALLQESLKTRLRDVQDELRHASATDELTGLPNRRSMQDELKQAERRNSADPMLAVMLADIDNFKNINDSLGHDAGDHVLRSIAQTLRGCLRESDRVARWGGEEFLVLLDVIDEREAIDIANRMRSTLEAAPLEYAGQPVHATSSFGIKVVSHSGGTLHEALIEADMNLLKAKKLGRNQVIAS